MAGCWAPFQCPGAPDRGAPFHQDYSHWLWNLLRLRSSSQIQGISVGTLTEITALYADELVLFIRDTGPSLQTAVTPGYVYSDLGP